MGFIKTIGLVILVAFLGLFTRELWRIYFEQQRTERVAKDGVRIEVRVDHVSAARKSWRDLLSNSKYVDFRYGGKSHTIRYSQDSLFLEDGIMIPVYYSPSADAFVQHIRGLHSEDLYKTSALVNFSVFRLARITHALLAFCWALTILCVIFALGILARMTEIELLWRIQHLIGGSCAIILAVYFSYNAIGNWRYYSRLRNGVAQQVKVEDIYETSDVHTRDASDDWEFTVYRARVDFHGEPRIIAVGRKDYEQVHKGEELAVLYDAGLDDMMGARYAPLVADYVFPFVVWAIVLVTIFRRKRKPGAPAETRP
jgi:hypothetical protein